MNETQIEYRAVIHFLWMKGLKNQEIQQQMCAVYGMKAPALRTIQMRTLMFSVGDHSILDHPRQGRPEKEELIPQIQKILDGNPYISTKKIAKLVNADPKTVKHFLIDKFNMKKVNFKWIPYQLTEKVKQERIQIAKQLLGFLDSCNQQKIKKVLTQDETWIYMINPRNSMWIEAGAQIPEKPRLTTASKKVMISVIWGITGIKSITMLPPGQKFNRRFFAENVLGDLARNLHTEGYFLHMDNARPHLVPEKLEQLGIQRLAHPPYSPDIAPSDFFLFGYLKKLLEGFEFQDETLLFQTVTGILNSISKDVFNSVYTEWRARLRLVQERDGSYIH